MDTVQKCSREYQSLDPAIVEMDVLMQLSQPCAQPQTLFVSNPGATYSKAVDGETDEHYPAQTGDRQFMTLIHRWHLTRTDDAYENSVGL